MRLSLDIRPRDTSPSSAGSLVFDSPLASPAATQHTETTSTYFAQSEDSSHLSPPTPKDEVESRAETPKPAPSLFSRVKLPSLKWFNNTSKVQPAPIVKEETLQGQRIALAGVEDASAASLIQHLSSATLALTTLPTSPSSSTSASSIRDAYLRSTNSEAQLFGHLNTFCSSSSIAHPPSSSPAELQHMASLLGGLDGLVIDMTRLPREMGQYEMAVKVVNPLVAPMVVPRHEKLWKGKQAANSSMECSCGQGAHATLFDEPEELECSLTRSRSGSTHSRTLSTRSKAQSTSSQKRGASATSTESKPTKRFTLPTPSSLFKRSSTTEAVALPAPPASTTNFARIVVIAPSTDRASTAELLYYLSSLRALTRDRLLSQLLPPRVMSRPRSNGTRRASPPSTAASHQKERSNTYVAPSSHHEHPRWAPRDRPSSSSSSSSDEDHHQKEEEEEEEVVPRLLKTFLLDPELVDEFLEPIMLGKFDRFDTLSHGIHFGAGKREVLRLHLAKLS